MIIIATIAPKISEKKVPFLFGLDKQHVTFCDDHNSVIICIVRILTSGTLSHAPIIYNYLDRLFWWPDEQWGGGRLNTTVPVVTHLFVRDTGQQESTYSHKNRKKMQQILTRNDSFLINAPPLCSLSLPNGLLCRYKSRRLRILVILFRFYCQKADQ